MVVTEITTELLQLAALHGACSEALRRYEPGQDVSEVRFSDAAWVENSVEASLLPEFYAPLWALAGSGSGDGYGSGYGSGSGYGYGYGSGDGDGYGYGSGDGDGDGYGYGDGDGDGLRLLGFEVPA